MFGKWTFLGLKCCFWGNL